MFQSEEFNMYNKQTMFSVNKIYIQFINTSWETSK